MERNFSNQRGSNRSNNRSSNSGQSMMSGWADTAKDRPIATAAAIGGAVAAGAFLWSRRNQISDQISNVSGQIGDQISDLSGQIGDWTDSMRSSSSSSSQQTGQSSNPMGAETRGQPEFAGAGASPSSSPRATGGSSGKAQRGDTLSPSRNQTPTPGV